MIFGYFPDFGPDFCHPRIRGPGPGPGPGPGLSPRPRSPLRAQANSGTRRVRALGATGASLGAKRFWERAGSALGALRCVPRGQTIPLTTVAIYDLLFVVSAYRNLFNSML